MRKKWSLYPGKKALLEKEEEEMQYVILTKIYPVAKGFGMVYNYYYPFLDSLTSSNEETRKTIEECVDALIRKEFIIPKAGGTFSITHKGIKEIENLLEASSQNKSSTSDRKKKEGLAAIG
jgi:hypothetical protein